jgi:hypothetical protein
MNSYFGPLPREYCVYFLILAVFFGILFVISLFSIATFIIMHYKKINSLFIVNSFLILFNTFLGYLANRLLYTMCVKSI